jgi:hypothetical protein
MTHPHATFAPRKRTGQGQSENTFFNANSSRHDRAEGGRHVAFNESSMRTNRTSTGRRRATFRSPSLGSNYSVFESPTASATGTRESNQRSTMDILREVLSAKEASNASSDLRIAGTLFAENTRQRVLQAFLEAAEALEPLQQTDRRSQYRNRRMPATPPQSEASSTAHMRSPGTPFQVGRALHFADEVLRAHRSPFQDASKVDRTAQTTPRLQHPLILGKDHDTQTTPGLTLHGAIVEETSESMELATPKHTSRMEPFNVASPEPREKASHGSPTTPQRDLPNMPSSDTSEPAKRNRAVAVSESTKADNFDSVFDWEATDLDDEQTAVIFNTLIQSYQRCTSRQVPDADGEPWYNFDIIDVRNNLM